MNKPLTLWFLVFTACAPPTPSPPVYTPPPRLLSPPDSLVDSTEYAAFARGGSGKIEGQAFLRTRGGDVKLSAGSPVVLDPVTKYSAEWFSMHSGNLQLFNQTALEAPARLFRNARRMSIADAEGRFEFTSLAPGAYFVHTRVTWEVATAGTQGGVVGTLVTVRDAETVRVIVTR